MKDSPGRESVLSVHEAVAGLVKKYIGNTPSDAHFFEYVS